jgi:hypothetical protein
VRDFFWEVKVIDSIGDAIASTAPPVARRDDELFGLVEKVVEERMPRRRRMRRRFVLGTAVFALVLGGTSVALATPDLHWPWGGSPERAVERVNPSGEPCTMAFKVHAEGVPDTDPAVTIARETLAAIDFETLQIDPVLLEENRARAAVELERWKSLGLVKQGTQADPDAQTFSRTVGGLIADGVRAAGLDPAHISIETAMLCGDDDGSRDDWN